MFSSTVIGHLQYYVYRLVDPRNGETFYVGKGIGNRVFDHVAGKISAIEDVLTEKLYRIREIQHAGLNVSHIIHRHGMDEDTAFEVESALIDAYPGLTNIVSGHDADERGVMNWTQIVELYEAPEAVFEHKVILININRSVSENSSIYDAVRCAWRIDPRKAAAWAEYILAVEQGLIVGVFAAEKWLPATIENFPQSLVNRKGRYGFIGQEASKEIQEMYLRKRAPKRPKGAANPISYY